MKESIINRSVKLINSKYDHDNDTMDRIRYGLEIIYITVTKLGVIFFVAWICGLLKETLLLCLFVNGLRPFAYGAHAKEGWQCYVSSIFAFILMPYVFGFITFFLYQKIILSILTILSMFLYAPADTHKRPIINAKQRSRLKTMSLLMSVIYSILILVIKNEMITNLMLLAMLTQSFLINPFIYKIFKLPFDNYKTYLNRGV